MSAYLHHITLNTGHSRRSYRHECADKAVSDVAGIVAAADQDGEAEFPSPTGLMVLRPLDASESRHVAAWTVNEPQGPALVTFAAAAKARPGAAVWRALHDSHREPFPLATRRDEMPPAPWLAVLLHMSGMAHPALEWLGDFERLVAWAAFPELATPAPAAPQS